MVPEIIIVLIVFLKYAQIHSLKLKLTKQTKQAGAEPSSVNFKFKSLNYSFLLTIHQLGSLYIDLQPLTH